MPLEQFEYIPNLVPTNPEGTDPFSQGDDHIRGIKETLLNTFPDFTGEPITVTEEQINKIPDLLNLLVITGEVRMWSTAIAPEGWLLCQGQAISRTTFEDLFAVIGITYGPGDSTTTFNVPDFKGRSPIGVGTGDAGYGTQWDLAEKGGAEQHVITEAQLPSHNHIDGWGTPYTTNRYGETGGLGVGPRLDAASNTTVGANTSSTGSGQAHSLMQPVLGINFIIKT